MTELLPVLESEACPEASAAQLYRAIYTQLCEGGKRFPVLVRDELTDWSGENLLPAIHVTRDSFKQ